jgi:hypothetical protein
MASTIGNMMSVSSRAPYMIVNPGETIEQAVRRHRRDTGYNGTLHIVAFNGRPGRTHGGRSIRPLMAVA